MPFDELVDRVAAVLGEERPDVVATFGPDGITGHPDHIRIGEAATAAFLRFAGDGGPGFHRLVYDGIRQSLIDRWNRRRVKAGLTAWDPDTVYHLRGVPDERIDIDTDTTTVALLVRRAMQEHRTQRNDMNNPEATEEQRVKSVSRETEVIAGRRSGRAGRSPTSSKTSDGRIGGQGVTPEQVPIGQAVPTRPTRV
jgi:LmbE family N-acetylglucosaminyl deacetylase